MEKLTSFIDAGWHFPTGFVPDCLHITVSGSRNVGSMFTLLSATVNRQLDEFQFVYPNYTKFIYKI